MSSEKANSGALDHANTSTDSSSEIESYAINERAFVRKLDWRLVPGIALLYLLSFLDRANVANATLFSLNDELGMDNGQYLNGLTLFFVGYVLLEVFWNVILKRIGPKAWLPTIGVVWGIVSLLQGFIQNKPGVSGVAGFYAVRFFLGVTEGGLFPGAVFYLSMWYKRNERQFRIALFFSMASLAGAFGGILAYGIGYMGGVGGYAGWRWIFIIEGILTIILAAAGYWYIADWPSKAKFLNENERAYVYARLKADSDATNNEGFSWRNVAIALKDPKVWLYCAGYHTLSLPLYTLSLFLPSIIKSLGYTAANAQLLTIPPYALATILTALYAWVSERSGRRAPFIIFSNFVAVIGYAILISNTDPTGRPGVSYVGTFFAAAGIYPSVAMTLSWPAINVSGQTKRATAGALQITIGNIGAIIGTQIYRAAYGPRYVPGHSTALGYMLGNVVVTSTLWYVLSRINKKRDAADAVANGAEIEGEWQGDADPRWRFST
ncbi:hypothetical protein AMS68_004701 [Peltaster fructicola]|uniref:Major facilitator superfamily (MFS) profile domain-containing protein n=1 Tax=Peltaster fructicola TaxID=286661 RepID=A0A6H0XWT0_9PEZI|nr:hypothetical protein AMS68_004701 [Peltaster fructicola]